jgi:hypothetical protein
MAASTLEKKELQLRKLTEQIKNERRKLDEKIGKNIVAALDLEYGQIDDATVEKFCSILREHYK